MNTNRLLIGLVDAFYVMIYARVKRVPLTARARWDTIWSSTKEASWSISTIAVMPSGVSGVRLGTLPGRVRWAPLYSRGRWLLKRSL